MGAQRSRCTTPASRRRTFPAGPSLMGIVPTVVPEHTRNEKRKRPGFLGRDPGLVGFELQGVRLCAPLARMLPIDLSADLEGHARKRALAVERQRAVGEVAEGRHGSGSGG